MYLKCTFHLLLQNVPQFEYFWCFFMVRFRLHFCQAHQKILICPIFVMLTLIRWLGKFLPGFSTVKLLLFSLLLIVTYEEILLYLCIDNYPISSSILVFTSSDSCMIKQSLLEWLLHGDFLIPWFPNLLAFYSENKLSLFLCLPILSVSHQDGLMGFTFLLVMIYHYFYLFHSNCPYLASGTNLPFLDDRKMALDFTPTSRMQDPQVLVYKWVSLACSWVCIFLCVAQCLVCLSSWLNAVFFLWKTSVPEIRWKEPQDKVVCVSNTLITSLLSDGGYILYLSTLEELKCYDYLSFA